MYEPMLEHMGCVQTLTQLLLFGCHWGELDNYLTNNRTEHTCSSCELFMDSLAHKKFKKKLPFYWPFFQGFKRRVLVEWSSLWPTSEDTVIDK